MHIAFNSQSALTRSQMKGHRMEPAELRSAIASRGMSQADFARALGVTRATVSRWTTDDPVQRRPIPPYMPLLLIAIDQVRPQGQMPL